MAKSLGAAAAGRSDTVGNGRSVGRSIPIRPELVSPHFSCITTTTTTTTILYLPLIHLLTLKINLQLSTETQREIERQQSGKASKHRTGKTHVASTADKKVA